MTDMTGKTVVITGGNSGIGFETAVGLARLGSRVVITARDADRGRVAVSAIAEKSGSDRIGLVVFDLASLAVHPGRGPESCSTRTSGSMCS